MYASADPWTINQGTRLGGVDFVYSGDQNSHYVMEARIPLGLLGLADAYHLLNIHWTMECGNDALDLGADVDPVPEPSTMALMFMGIVGSLAAFVRKRYNEVRRGFDIALAAAGLVITSPLRALAALLIKLDSRGPVFYKQVRVGQNRRNRRNTHAVDNDRRKADVLGEQFTIFKLRTMRMDDESGTGPIWAGNDDDRVTRIGRLLRMTRIDEIPQFINVLKGEMSIIGPRPERPSFVCNLNEKIRYYHRRFNVKPGITGLAQVRYQYAASVKDTRNKLKYDLLYVRKRCMYMDLRILFNTFWTVLSARGAR
jgi:lipopolysaccharide/colanic/teichoic acid biosynthesis glycosyltransferase